MISTWGSSNIKCGRVSSTGDERRFSSIKQVNYLVPVKGSSRKRGKNFNLNLRKQVLKGKNLKKLCQDKRRLEIPVNVVVLKIVMKEIAQLAPAEWQNVSQCFSVES